MNVRVAIFVLVVGLLGPASFSACRSHENAADAAVTLDELQKMLEEEQKPLLLDVRLASDFDEAPNKISSAKWRDPKLVDKWGQTLPKDREIIVYCVHGRLISRAAARHLRELGLDARILEGGIEAWKESGREVRPAQRE